MNKATMRPTRHKGKRLRLHEKTLQTLGSGNMLKAVTLPEGEDESEWLAMNTVDFFNELSVLFGVVEEDTQRITKAGEGFPDGFEYRWADGVGIKTPIKCSSTDYIDYVMTWVEGQMNNEAIFPTSESTPFPPKFKKYVQTIFKRLFRVFAILYCTHLKAITDNNAIAHLNTCFRHFMFFSFVYHLVEPRELKALPGLTGKLRKEYKELKHQQKEARKHARSAGGGGGSSASREPQAKKEAKVVEPLEGKQSTADAGAGGKGSGSATAGDSKSKSKSKSSSSSSKSKPT